MALFLDGPLPLEDTIAFVQSIPLPSNNQFTQMMPSKQYDSDEIDFATITKTNRAAKFRNWDGSFWIAPRDTGSEKRVRMLPLGGQLSVGEYERRQIEMARYGGTIQSVLVDAIYNDLENLTRYAQNRVELAWGDVLTDGVLTINENGVQQQVDYGIPAGQLVTPATLWSNHATSTPLTDLIGWTGIYAGVNGDRDDINAHEDGNVITHGVGLNFQSDPTVGLPVIFGICGEGFQDLMAATDTGGLYPPITGITVTPSTATLTVANGAGHTKQLKVVDSNGLDRTALATYQSDATAKATVDALGLITAVAAGTANVAASYGGFSAACAATVS